MNTHIPYTYFLKWSATGVKYYGVRYRKGCSPSDLWNPYKTSSNYVKRYIKLHGDPDIREIRKTFKTPKEARIWEDKVIRRTKAVFRDDFLNKKQPSDGFRAPWGSKEYREKIGETIKRTHALGKIWTSKRRRKQKKIMSERAKKMWRDPEKRKSQTERSRAFGTEHFKMMSDIARSSKRVLKIRTKNMKNVNLRKISCPYCSFVANPGHVGRHVKRLHAEEYEASKYNNVSP